MTITPTLNYSGETVPLITYEYSDDDSLGYSGDTNTERSALVAEFVPLQQEQQQDDQDVGVMTLEEELDWTKHKFNEIMANLKRENHFIIVEDSEVVPAETETGSDQILTLKKPTASNIHYFMMHPVVYSYLKPLYDLEQVAEFLGYQDHSVWRQKVEVAKQDRSVQSLLRNALKPGSRNEASFSIVFSVLPPMIAYAIEPEFDLQYLLKTRCKTGGYLACSEYDLISRRDLYYTTYATGKAVFGTEVKAVASFPHDDAWYHDNRSAQVFSALYSLNAPLLLVTPNIFKLFIENEDRNRVFTYPYRSDVDPRHGSKEVVLCHEQLVDIIVLLLLRP